jgi:hypothetical protein
MALSVQDAYDYVYKVHLIRFILAVASKTNPTAGSIIPGAVASG